MEKKCSICGCAYSTFAFKGGFVCENCLQYVRDNYRADHRLSEDK